MSAKPGSKKPIRFERRVPLPHDPGVRSGMSPEEAHWLLEQAWCEPEQGPPPGTKPH